MMSAEGPFLAAIIARLVDPKFNLAAYGVAFAFAILIEAPVIMLMSASTALVEDRDSYCKLRNFTNVMNGVATAVLLLALIPAFFDWLMITIIGLPPEVARLTYGAMWFFLPWPAAIGYRRFLHGLLIRRGRTRLVALGTVLRLSTMTLTATAFYLFSDMPGAWVGAAALSMGVTVELIVSQLMARQTICELKRTPHDPQGHNPVPLGYQGIIKFYYPLALTSLIALTVQPMLTFFMGRAPSPIESLAVFPVVHALSFVFRSFGLSFQEAALALLGRNNEHYPEVARFGLWLGLATSAMLGLVAFTPLVRVWFGSISGLTPELIAFAVLPAQILVPLPAMSVLLSLQRAVLMQRRRTGPITGATVIEVVVIVGVFLGLGWGADMVGVTSAFLAFLAGRLAGNLYLIPSSRRAVRE